MDFRPNLQHLHQEMKTCELKHVSPNIENRKNSFLLALQTKFQSNRDDVSRSGNDSNESDADWGQ